MGKSNYAKLAVDVTITAKFSDSKSAKKLQKKMTKFFAKRKMKEASVFIVTIRPTLEDKAISSIPSLKPMPRQPSSFLPRPHRSRKSSMEVSKTTH